MAIIKDMLKEELERLKQMEQSYMQKIDSLPKGSIVNKKINNKNYSYLVYRNGNKVLTKYIKPEDLDDINKKVLLRNQYKKDLKEIREDMKITKKVVRM
ncbi:hypothetical protein RBH29_08415 [Herbivorax sp. ANBcel31]|uniref:hypothetical protein n=1 Tax=Herbivorax sp. ANBcel31 TaxID=3069754 RepID=UPI0027B46E38|nr:hypothetical protein [Herbivorax sp. ANBcel31]MDQ2086451.1 hypothetical protein [Herbivorax sp. ANBcel31]